MIISLPGDLFDSKVYNYGLPPFRDSTNFSRVDSLLDGDLSDYKKTIISMVTEKYYLMKFTIENKEDIEIKELKINIPGNGSYRLVGVSGFRDTIFNDEINLPVLKPENNLDIWAWTTSYLYSDELDKTQIKLTGPAGSYKTGDSPFLSEIYEWYFKNYLMTVPFTLLILVWIIYFYQVIKANKLRTLEHLDKLKKGEIK